MCTVSEKMSKKMQPVVCCQWCEKVLNKSGNNNKNNNGISLILQCSGCQRASYCDKKCQRKDWALHQTRCPSGGGGGGGTNTCSNNSNDIDLLSSFEEVSDMMARMPHSLDTNAKRNTVIQVLGSEEPLRLFWSRYVEVKRSEYVHGRGLFVVSPDTDGQCLPVDAAITCYPVHLLFDANGKLITPKRGKNNNTNPRRDMTHEQIQELINSHGTLIGSQQTAVGLPDQCQEKRLLGHMVNDACLVDVFASFSAEELRDDLALLKRLVVTLLKNVIKYTNCAFLYDERRLVRVLVTRREIKPGEELLVNYGLDYWLEKHYGPRHAERHPYITTNIQKLVISDIDVQRLMTQTALQLDMPILLAEMTRQKKTRS